MAMEGEFGAIGVEMLSSLLRRAIAQTDTDYEQKKFVA